MLLSLAKMVELVHRWTKKQSSNVTATTVTIPCDLKENIVKRREVRPVENRLLGVIFNRIPNYAWAYV